MSDRHRDHPRPPSWHALSKDDVEQELQTGPEGLTEDEARRRLVQYGSNRLTPPARRGPLLRLIMQFHNILLYVMLGAAVITAVLGHWVDTGVLLAAVAINAIIGFIQEGKAEAALDAIRAMLSPHATVIRGGHRRELDAADLVPGDWVILTSGDRIPADLRLVFDVGGVGYAPEGDFSIDSHIVDVAHYPALQIAYTHAGFMHAIFDSTDLTLLEWGKVTAAGLLVFAAAELEKFVIRRTGLAARLSHA